MTTPGGMVMPGSGSSLPPPSMESTPSELEAIPGNGSAKPTTGTGTGSGTGTGPGTGTGSSSSRVNPGNNKAVYESSLPRTGIVARRKPTDVARGYPAAAPEASSSRPAPAGGFVADSADLLDRIPPVDLSPEFTRKAGALVPAPAPAPTPVATPGPAAAQTPAPPAAETASAAEGGSNSPPQVVAATSRQAPGIRRSASVAPGLGGGSVPSVEGLDWLKEKGYRTFVDLRQGAEIEPTFAEAVNDRGMVYISLPIMASRLDPSRVARFDDLISRPENRPLYFCDTDGSRAGLAWYLHLRGVEGDDSQSAFQKAEEIGLTGYQLTQAEAFLAAHKPKAVPPVATAAPVPKPASAAASGTGREPALVLPPDPQHHGAEMIAPDFGPSPLDTPPLPTVPGEPRLQSAHVSDPTGRDLAAWRPAVALVLTGVGVPLAFWSRSAFNEARAVRRASLPAAARRSLESPAGSDA